MLGVDLGLELVAKIVVLTCSAIKIDRECKNFKLFFKIIFTFVERTENFRRFKCRTLKNAKISTTEAIPKRDIRKQPGGLGLLKNRKW